MSAPVLVGIFFALFLRGNLWMVTKVLLNDWGRECSAFERGTPGLAFPRGGIRKSLRSSELPTKAFFVCET